MNGLSSLVANLLNSKIGERRVICRVITSLDVSERHLLRFVFVAESRMGDCVPDVSIDPAFIDHFCGDIQVPEFLFQFPPFQLGEIRRNLLFNCD